MKAPKKVPAAATSAYVDIDLPLEDEEDEGIDSKEEAALALKWSDRKGLDLTLTDKTEEKREEGDFGCARDRVRKQDAMKDDKNAYAVMSGYKGYEEQHTLQAS